MIPSHIIIHHSLTKDGETVSWNAIRNYHVNELGWNDIGYHFGVERVGDRHEALVGRMLSETGAHCKEEGMNSKSVGICIVGNFNETDVPPQALDLTIKLVTGLQIVLNIPKTNIHMHRDFAPYKSCPGERFPWRAFMERLQI